MGNGISKPMYYIYLPLTRQRLTPASRLTVRILIIFFYVCSLEGLQAQVSQYVPGEILIKIKSHSQQKTAITSSRQSGIPEIDAINENRQFLKIEPLAKQSSMTALRNIYKVSFAKSENLQEIIELYTAVPEVEFAQPNYIYKLDFTPNDSLFGDQTALKVIQAELAWDLQLASPDIIVGIIDTGIDYHHEDLTDALWINPGEDLNANGIVDSTDFNGIDDDNNGFIDDIRGWDFTDAPTFPDGGDFQTPDNDPFDENGHGTSVAGIIGATGNNRKGIAGLAFGCQIMNLRAGTSLGFLEEDDVASAIAYAVENGAKIINMSFGDEVASPLLRDVMQYAFEQGVILVASAGNSATDNIHFPSGFPETLSVGATTPSDNLAGFSNFGSSVDVVAPGVDILTTKLNNAYGGFSGTSASAPLVSALAALILSKTPELPPESVKGLITSSADDLGQAGWDDLFASGRINAFKAIQSPTFLLARITQPELDQGFSTGTVAIYGTAAGAFLDQFILELGIGETPDTWTVLHQRSNERIIDELIMDLPVNSLEDTTYTLRLIVMQQDGNAIEDKVRFFVDRSPPVISNLRQTPMLDGDQVSLLIEFETDDICDASIHFRSLGSSEEFQKKALRFQTTTHRINFTQEFFLGNFEFFVEVENGAGLSRTADNNGEFFTAFLSSPPIGGIPVQRLPLEFRSGFLLEKTSDFDQDGSREVLVNEYDQNSNFTFLKILEFQAGQFQEVYASDDVLIPRDWGDSDGDGLLEILAGRGGSSFILEARTPNQFPTELFWSETIDVWASRFADLDRDGLGEIILRINDVFTIWETTGDNSFAQTTEFPNPTPGPNAVGVPRSEIGDFDGDNSLEILFGDFDGDIYIYENIADNTYEYTWSTRLPLVDAIDYLSVGDYDGDGITDFTVGCHSDPSLATESTFDSRHWLYRVYNNIGDNSYEVAWEQAFFGLQSPANFDSGVSSGDVDNDGSPEILINVFPDFYVVDFDTITLEYKTIWHAQPNRSNKTIVADLDNNSFNEFYFNDGNKIVAYEFLTDFTGPSSPLGFKGRPLDTSLVELTWQPSGSFDEFRIYRGTSPDNQNLIASTLKSVFLDSTVLSGKDYWYSVTKIDSVLTPIESPATGPIKVRPGPKPFIKSAVFLFPNQVRIVFSEPMSSSVKDQTNYEIENLGAPESAIVHQSGQSVILTSSQDIPQGAYNLTANNLTDLDGTPIDTSRSSASFEVITKNKAPYLINAILSEPNQIQLEFSEAMDVSSISQLENYVIEPEVKLSEAVPEEANTVLLKTDKNTPLVPFGISYIITVKNVRSELGELIEFGLGDSAALVFSTLTLENVFVFPNPWRSDMPQDFVTIAGLTATARIKILDTSGRVIRTLKEIDGNGGIQWDLKNESGQPVASGIYLFYVFSGTQKATGKFAVIR